MWRPLSSAALVEAVATQILTAVSTNRAVYRHEVPDAPADAYIVVRSSVGTDDDDVLGAPRSTREPTVTITSVAPQAADALWGAQKAHDALSGWTPSVGSLAWRGEPASSLPPTLDPSLPTDVFYAVEQWGYRYLI